MAETRFIHGFHAVAAKLKHDPDAILELHVAAQRGDARARDLLTKAEAAGVRIMPTDTARLDGMAGTSRHQGVVAKIDPRHKVLHLSDILEDLTENALFLVLDGIQDPHNLGACLRVADAAGVHAVVAPKDKAVGINATVAKVASGAAEHVPYIMVTNLARTLREIKEYDIWVVGTDDQAEKSLYQSQVAGPIAWVMGAEGEGMRRLTREHCDELVNIPMAGSVSSLNVSVASGVCLFETVRQRGVAK